MDIKPHLWDYGVVMIDMIPGADGVFDVSEISDPIALGGINREASPFWKSRTVLHGSSFMDMSTGERGPVDRR